MLRLHHDGVSAREIGRTLGVARSTIQDNLRRAHAIGIAWPVPAELTDDMLEQRLFARAGVKVGLRRRSEPDWATLARELKRPGVSLMVLWEEYRQSEPDGYGYSRFCDLYIAWRRGVSATMRQTHVAGEKLFVDYAGDTVPVFDRGSGEERRAHVFVAVLGASNYTYAEARWSEGLADWVGAHVNALAFLGGAPKLLVCDNLRAGVTAACRYEPGINRTYQEMAAHYSTAVLPTRVRRPRDKAKVEVAVLIVERFILARLRNRRFLSLGELNEAIREVLGDLNARLMRKLGSSRREFFETIDRPALLALPAEPYAYAEWRRCRVAPDYHVELHGHFYSVPSRLIREVVEARITDTTIEVFHAGQRVAAHPRSALKRRHTTTPEHMPSAHRRYASWTPARMQSFAAQVGPGTTALVETIMRTKPHPEQGFRACLGILQLAKTYGAARLEAACQRGLSIGAHTYGSIASILKTGLDRAFHDDAARDAAPLLHANIRGRGYYH
jgi:transposase